MCGREIPKYLLSEWWYMQVPVLSTPPPRSRPCQPLLLAIADWTRGEPRIWAVNSQSAQHPRESAGHEKMSWTFQIDLSFLQRYIQVPSLTSLKLPQCHSLHLCPISTDPLHKHTLTQPAAAPPLTPKLCHLKSESLSSTANILNSIVLLMEACRLTFSGLTQAFDETVTP